MKQSVTVLLLSSCDASRVGCADAETRRGLVCVQKEWGGGGGGGVETSPHAIYTVAQPQSGGLPFTM